MTRNDPAITSRIPGARRAARYLMPVMSRTPLVPGLLRSILSHPADPLIRTMAMDPASGRGGPQGN